MGETFHLDLDATAIVGRYIEVDPRHRMLLVMATDANKPIYQGKRCNSDKRGGGDGTRSVIDEPQLWRLRTGRKPQLTELGGIGHTILRRKLATTVFPWHQPRAPTKSDQPTPA